MLRKQVWYRLGFPQRPALQAARRPVAERPNPPRWTAAPQGAGVFSLRGHQGSSVCALEAGAHVQFLLSPFPSYSGRCPPDRGRGARHWADWSRRRAAPLRQRLLGGGHLKSMGRPAKVP